MKKTGEQRGKEFLSEILRHGFEPAGQVRGDGAEIFQKTWSRETEVLWYGKRDTTLTLMVCGGQFPALWIYRNGILEDVRRYRSCGYLMNGLKLILEYNGYEF